MALLFAIPLGVWAGLSDRVNRIVTPFLDFMQTMPTFVYLAPLTLFFLIGPASATIATTIYAAPPAIRITAHAIRSVPQTTVEAADSMGATRRQLLLMSKRTVVMGINQTIMAALAMVTIAALINAPGLGATVIQALQSLDVGTAFNAGLAIVVMAIVLDRVTTAASGRAETARGSDSPFLKWRRQLLAAGAVVAAVLVYLSHTYLWAAEFPGEGGVGSGIARTADEVTTWAQDNLSGLTNAFPKESLALWDAFRRGDMEKALAIYRWFMPLLHLDADHDLVQSIKIAEQVMGRGHERVRPPRHPLVGARRAEVIAMVEKAAATRPVL